MEEFSFTVTDIFRYVYNLLLDSGFRLVEAVKLMAEIGEVESVNGFYRCRLGYFRETKQAYFAYPTEYTLSLVREARREPLKEHGISHYFSKYGYVGPKYVRKFVFDKMIELEVP